VIKLRFFLTLVLLVHFCDAWIAEAFALPKNSATIVRASNGVVYLTVRTALGLDQMMLTLNHRISSDQPATEQHLRGVRRLRTYEKLDVSNAALSITGSSFAGFYTDKKDRLVYVSGQGNRISISVTRHARSAVCLEPLAAGLTKERVSGRASRSALFRGVETLNPPRVLDIATDADFQFFKKKKENTQSYIRTVLNAVESIYLSSLGVRLNLVDQHVFTSNSQPYNTSDSSSLLKGFRSYTLQTKQIKSADVYHLFSGKIFNNNVAGLAYLGGACVSGGTAGFSISRAVKPELDPLIVAHEIGHSLSATHDATPGSLMSPYMRTSDTRFSFRSLNQMLSFIKKKGSCLEGEG